MFTTVDTLSVHGRKHSYYLYITKKNARLIYPFKRNIMLKLGHSSLICLSCLSLQEHTSAVCAVQFDDFQVISGSSGSTLLKCDFLDPTPTILRT